jgi:nitrous oxidase accessory protein NosD
VPADAGDPVSLSGRHALSERETFLPGEVMRQTNDGHEVPPAACAECVTEKHSPSRFRETKMNSTLRFALLTAFLLLVLGVGPAYAGPSPVDGTAQSDGGPSNVFQTALFALGEVDLSTLGVSATELLTVGPQLTLTSSTGGDMLIVDDDGLDCPNRDFMFIQAAVNAASPGDKIKVCRGSYMEQVTIGSGKDGLTLFSEAAFQAVIRAPLVMADQKAIVRVTEAQDVTIRHFTITGPGAGGCDSIRYGVRVDTRGSALITDNHITEIHDTPFGGCQNGIGVDVGRELVDGPTSGTATVVHNLIDKYQKAGVLVDSSGSSGEVAYNEIIGAGPLVAPPAPAQNGIQVSRTAHGDVHHNKVSQNLSRGDTDATGILLYSDPLVRVHHNDVFLNGSGIGICDVEGTATVSYNNSRQNINGIHAYTAPFCPTARNLISYNKAFENFTDCRDDTIPTPNSWVKDLGRTENQAGLCKDAGPKP